MKLIIQIPCLNESQTLHHVVADLPKQIDGIDCIEMLVIDDGSDDETSLVARELGVHHVVRHTRNRGLAAAFATGLNASLKLGADVIVNTDGDHQYSGAAIADLVKPILEHKTDIVIGDRRPGSDLKFSPLKRFLQRLGRRVVSRLAGRDLADPVSGFRAYSRKAAMRTHIVTGYSYTIESLMQATCKGLAIEFVPIQTNAVMRPSRLFRSLPEFLSRSAVTLLRVFFMFHPLRVLSGLSALLALVGILPILRFLVLFAMGNGDGHLQSLVLGGVLLILAAIVLVAGLIADLIAHNRRLMEMILEELAEQKAVKEYQNEPTGDEQAEMDSYQDSRFDKAHPRDDLLERRHVAARGEARKGLTLIELLVVFGIVSILMG